MAEEVGAGAGVTGAAEGVGTIPTARKCSVEIMNNCAKYSLCTPRMFIESGSCRVCLSPYIGSRQSHTSKFTNTPGTACGAVAVFTYQLQQNDTKQITDKMAVMFSVPFDYNLYSNWFAVGIFNKNQDCDYNLYYRMYYKSDKSFIRGKASGPVLIYESSQVTIRATMSDTYHPILTVRVTDN